MRVKYLIAVCFIVLCFNSKSQAYSASNFTLISVISPESYFSGCWGWFQANKNKEYAIAGSYNGVYWVDVTNPATPTISAFRAGNQSNWREIKSYQNYCYVSTENFGSYGFQIFDMQYLPDSVHKVYDSNALFARGHALWIDGTRLYVSGVTYSTGATSSMDVYSLATPTAPVLIRKLSQDAPFIGYVHDTFARNDTVFASCGNQGLYVFNLSNTNTFTPLGSLTTYSGSGYNHSTALTPNGQTLIIADEVPASLPIKVADVSNLSNIQVLATTNQFPQTTPHNPFVVSNTLFFMSSYQDGLQLFDISNPSSPVLAGYFDTYPAGGGNNNNWSGSAYNGQWGAYPYFPSKNILAVDRSNGIFMLKTDLYQNPNPNFNITGTNCPGTNVGITNTSSASISYSWSFPGGLPANSTATNPTVTYPTAGVYSITLLASNSTSATSITQTINITAGPTILLNTPVICEGNSATLTASGAVSYTWSSGSNLASVIDTPSITTVYTVTGSNGVCDASQTGTIVVNTNPITTVTVANSNCTNSCSGIANANTTAGNAPYTYSLIGSNCTNLPCLNLCAGNYTLATNDVLGCYSINTFSVFAPTNNIIANISATNAACGTCSTGIANINASGGSGPYTYNWLPSGGNLSTATNLAPGCYTVTVTDANACSVSTATCVMFITDLRSLNTNYKDVLIYPNPAHSNVTIEYNGSLFNYALYNNLGQLVTTKLQNQTKTVIPLNEISKGVYLLEVEIETVKVRRKLIIE